MDESDGRLQRLRAKAMKLPLTPGVYLMRDKSGKIIYIGKAKALKNRVSQYFGSQGNHTAKVFRMVEKVADFDYILCDSEFEALILECSQIKLHGPKYNILLKDDKGYHYIKVTDEEYPRITAEKQVAQGGARYIGPYASSFVVNQSVDEALKLFKLPSCGRVFPRDIGRERPCLNHFIGQCCSPCTGGVSVEEYGEAVADALEFLRGGQQASLTALQAKMEQAAENLEFEKAARLRDRLRAIQRVGEKQKVYASKIPEQDVVALVSGAEDACFEVFRFVGGRLVDREYFLVGGIGDPAAARYEFITRYYSQRDRVPPHISIDGEVEDEELLRDWLSEKAGRRVGLAVPQRGDAAQLIKMCRANAAEHIAQKIGRTGKETAALEELAKLLGLSKPPHYVEAYDISHTAGSEAVGGMVVFEDGRPCKSAYRRFKIQSAAGQDDYASMHEVMTRRLNEYKAHSEAGDDAGFGRLPDLILLDGGQGQVHAVLPALDAAGVNIPLFGMVKDDRHRTRAIAADGGEIAITGTRSAFTLVSTIQEEVHRFAVAYHHARQKKTLASTLTEIEGVGPKRAAALMKALGSVKAVAAAPADELARVKGVDHSTAERVFRHFHPDVAVCEPDEPEDETHAD